MSEFRRRFPLDLSSPESDRDAAFRALIEPNPWLADLLRHWRVAGSGSSGNRPHLRLAIRDGYMNLYRNGQSVAKVEIGRDGPRAQVHEKYLSAQTDGEQRYLRLDAGGIGRAAGPEGYDAATHLDAWLARAGDHAGAEKTFVDEVVARNPDVIDLEMGLPAGAAAEQVAPRIDLVALEPSGDGWQVALWEAKVADDGRIRRRGDDAPEVVDQLGRYRDWLARPDEAARVIDACRETCRLLVELHRLVTAHLGADPGELGPGIRAVAAGAPLALDPAVRLLIDNRAERESFEANGHRGKLERAGLHVHAVPGNGMVLGRPA